MPFNSETAKKAKAKSSGRGINKKTQESIQRVEWVLTILEPKLQEDIEAISAKDRVMLWNDLQEYIRPKLQRTTIVGDNEEPIILNVNLGRTKP